MIIDLKKIPFSRRGSFQAVSIDKVTGSLLLRDMRGGDESDSTLFYFSVENKKNEFVDTGSRDFTDNFQISVKPWILEILDKNDSSRRAAFILKDNSSIYIKSQGIGLKFKAKKLRYDSLNHMEKACYVYISYKKETRYRLEFKNDSFYMDAPWETVGNAKVEFSFIDNELRIFNYKIAYNGEDLWSDSFDEAVAEIKDEYISWSRVIRSNGTDEDDSSNLAAYILWASIVHAEGNLSEETIYVSKNWMQNIWSWDNCFNALGVEKVDPELAYKQFKLFIDKQSEEGAYPDFINDKFLSFNCLKPPIHAWAYQSLMNRNRFFEDHNRLSTVYESIKKSTLFWLEKREVKGEAFAYYYSHGNDSGWDNASIFHHGLPVAAPDLMAYLVQQLDILDAWKSRLGIVDNEHNWKELANKICNKLLTDFWDKEKGCFIARSALTYEEISEHNSAILRLPIVIAYRLPRVVIDAIVNDLIENFEVEFGIPTEKIKSPNFKGNGYWLGPIWAPETYIFIDALLRTGDLFTARRLAEKYCKMADIGGMAENYNPLTAQGNDDLSFTWTSSVFLLLKEFLINGDKL